MKSFIFLKDNEALVLRAVRPFADERNEDQERFIDDFYLFKGPGTYEPRVEEVVHKYIEATIVLPNQALLCVAVKDTIDAFGQEHKAGTKVNPNYILIYFYSGYTGRQATTCQQQR